MTHYTLYVGTETPPQHYTLTADAGSFALSGQAATPAYNSDFAWLINDNEQFDSIASSTLPIATGVPTGAVYYASPDLLPGQTLSVTAGVLSIVSDADLPTVNGDSAGSPIDEISARDVVIEVMDSPIAHIRNATQNIEYPYAATGSWSQHDSQPANRWNWVIGQANDGDVIEISPGAAQAVEADSLNYHSNSLDSCGLAVLKQLTIKNIDGRGRWRVYPSDVVPATNRNAIGVFTQADWYGSTRGEIVLQGFDITDQFLTAAAGVRLRQPAAVDGSWAADHASVTLRNFKIGRTSGGSLSGVSGGGAETLTLEDGHIFDCGNASGQEHNAYVSAKTMILRGLRMSRTRGHSSTPPGSGNWDGSVTLEGHILKASAVTGTVEGCVFDCVALADCSHLVQMKAGGNWTLRGNLFVDSQYPMTARGMINMARELSGDIGTAGVSYATGATTNGSAYSIGDTVITLASAGTGPLPTGWFITFPGDANLYKIAIGNASVASGGTITLAEPGLRVALTSGAKAITVVNRPNYEWWAGSEGNSLTIERNVFVGRYPRAVVYMFDWSTGTWFALYPPGDADATADMILDTMTIQDNIAMITDTAANHMLSGFPGTNDAMWINFDPTGGTYWTARGNTKETYTAEPWAQFDNQSLLLFTRAAGTVAASGSLATKRFVWPHGYMTRTDSFRGLA